MSGSRRIVSSASVVTRLWSRLSVRERFLIYTMLFAAAVAAHVFLVVRPHEERRAALEAEAEQATRLLERVAALGAVDITASEVTDPRPVAVLVADTAAELGISLSRLSERDNSVELEMATLSFEVLVRWLHDLMNVYGVEVERLELTRSLEPGMISARLALSMEKTGQ